MTKYCPLTRTYHGDGVRCFEKECVLYDMKENVCLIKKALESCTPKKILLSKKLESKRERSI